MNLTRISLLLLCFLSLCFVGACRTTESQIRQFSPTLLERIPPIDQEAQLPATPTPPGRAAKLQWFLLTVAILAVVVLVFATDRGQEKKRTPARRSPSKKRRKK